MLSDTINSQVANYLSAYVFDKVWNEPFREFRKNIVPYNSGVGLYSGYSRLGSGDLFKLPGENGTPFIIYSFPNKVFGGINFGNIKQWMSVSELIEQRKIELRAEGFNGVSLFRGDIYVRGSSDKRHVFIAVKQKMFNDILGRSTPKTEIYFSVYYDSDDVNDNKLETFHINRSSNVNEIFEKIQQASYVLINGRFTTVSSVEELEVLGTYVEVVTDANILGIVEFDVGPESSLRSYQSSIDLEMKKILHIPKNINPSDVVITHNTCDFFIYKTDEEGVKSGVYVNRLLSDSKIVQITHNDFGLNQAVIDEYASLLGTNELTLVMMIRTHSKNNTLIRDKNYIDLLYYHDDETIQDFLIGNGPEYLSFWEASHLDVSKYVEMMFNTPNSIGMEHIDDYVDVLGYYHTIALISDRIFQTSIQPADPDSTDNLEFNFTRRFTVKLPVIFSTVNVYPNISINGFRLDDDDFTVKRISSNKLEIVLRERVVLNANDEVNVEIFENVADQVVKVYSEPTNNTIPLISEDFIIYEVNERFSPGIGIEKEYTTSYVQIEDISTVVNVVEIGGEDVIVFKPSTYNNTYVVAYNIGFLKKEYLIDDILDANEPLVFDMDTLVTDMYVPTEFQLSVHTEKTEPTGTMIDPSDPSAASSTPAWHLVNGKIYSDTVSVEESRWDSELPAVGYREAKYTLNGSYQNTHYATGFQIGAADVFDLSKENIERIADNPKSFDVLIDGEVVYSVRNKDWRDDPKKVHNYFFETPILVNESFSIRVFNSTTEIHMAFDQFNLLFTDTDYSPKVPLLSGVKVVAYLNGRELVEGIDFVLQTIVDPTISESIPSVMGRQLVVSNTSYLKSSNNKLVVLISRNNSVGGVEGFLDRDKLGGALSTAFWFDELSTVSVDGFVTRNQTEEFGDVVINSSKFRNGAVYGTRTLIPSVGKAFIDKYHEDDDSIIIHELIDYFSEIEYPDPEFLLLPYSHRLTSIYLSIIARDIADETLEVDFIEDDEDFLNQFSDYEYLKDLDPILGNELIDLDFVDIQPTYVQQTNESTIVYRVLNKLTALTLSNDSVLHRRYDHEPVY